LEKGKAVLDRETLEREYYENRKSQREIAEQYGVTQTKVARWMKNYGLKSRPPTENKMPTAKGSHLDEEHKKAISEAMTDNPKNYMQGRVLEDHPNWKGGVRAYRRMKLADVPLVCADCGAGEIVKARSNLYVHHIDGDRSNNRIDNLVVLCCSCHRKRHNEDTNK
jgi:transposase-like protein